MCKMQSETIGNLATALAMAQGEITFALKDSVADMGMKGGRRKYADLQSVIEAIKGPLAKNGLAYIQSPMSADNGNGIVLRTTLCHKSGEWIASEFFLPIDRMGGIQGMGSAITYARRYALSAMIGVAADEDDDGEASQSAWRNGQQARQPQAPAQRPQGAPQRPVQRPQGEPQRPAPRPAPAPQAEQQGQGAPDAAQDLQSKQEVIRSAFFTKAQRQFGTEKADLLKGLGTFFGREVKSSSEITLEEMVRYVKAQD